MAQDPVRPLNIMKSKSYTSPSKGRPLSEINPMGIRRNSPSYNQLSKKTTGSADSSPFEASPAGNGSPRSFWKSKDISSPARFDTENMPQNPSPSLRKRSSIENLKKASHVKNSNMFAKEHEQDYDPDASSLVDRPLANGRPLSVQLQGNAWGGSGLDGLRNQTSPSRGHRRTESSTSIPLYDPTKSSGSPSKAASPNKSGASPQKSSLSSRLPMYNSEDGVWSDDETSRPGTGANTPRAALRQPKSVTFDAAPPTINEYEMITPDPSSVASGSREGSYDSDVYDMDDSFERDNSYERDDSFDESLEDTDKTPVVLPEDWRFMSPEAANTDLADTFEDPFKGTRKPDTSSEAASASNEEDISLARSDSVNSNGDSRPLPPLPSTLKPSSSGSIKSRSSETKQTFGSPKPSPPRPASISKDDLLKMSNKDMPLADRLHLLSLQNLESETKRRQSITSASDNSLITRKTSEVTHSESAPQITRESVMSKIKTKHFEGMQYNDSSPASSPKRSTLKLDYANLDPDVPIPSRETSSDYEAGDRISKPGDDEKTRIVAMYAKDNKEDEESFEEDDNDCVGIESSVIHHDIPDYDYDEESEVSSLTEDGIRSMVEPSVTNDWHFQAGDAQEDRSVSLPEFKTILGEEDFKLGLGSYMTPSASNAEKSLPEAPQQTIKHEEAKRPLTPEEIDTGSPHMLLQGYVSDTSRDVSTPESVIHHPIESHEESEEEAEEGEDKFASETTSSSIPEPVATIKTHGSRLKTRASATPADIRAMAAARRQVSGESPPQLMGDDSNPGTVHTATGRRQSFKMKLDIPMESLELGFGLDREFDRLLEAQKKGYMTREQEEVVVASTRNFSNENPAQKKQDESQTNSNQNMETTATSPKTSNAPSWTTEPWNGRMRRQSTRKSIISPEKKVNLGAMPPLPGQESNVDLIVEENYDSLMDVSDEPRERGRLFVKVVKLTDLDLPLPRNQPSYFQLTLDNGLHCVTTAWLELGKTAPIGQEFELVVFDDLEFQLTLQTKIERPVSQASTIDSTEKVPKPQKTGGVGKFFMGAKKRREMEKKQQQEEEARANLRRKQELDAQRATLDPSAWDLQHDLIGADGSFARAYISLGNHEQQAFGRPCTIDVPCFNEWSVDDKGVSTRSKLGGIQRRPPYRIARMEIQLLYIPRPRDAKDEDLPKSMSAAARQLKEAETAASRFFEGHLSQQGGDCPYWRRRFFKLNGSELKAYHEHTKQPRAKISLAKATKIIDDRTALTKAEGSELDTRSPSKKGGRRKSAFAQDEEGYMFVEEGFRIRFANGEVIDFYADSKKEKEAWMSVLSEAIGRDASGDKQTWTQVVLARDRLLASKAAQETSKIAKSAAPASPAKSAPTSPQKSFASSSIPKPTTVATTALMKEKPLPNEPKQNDKITASPSKLKQPVATSPKKALARPSASTTASGSPSKRNSVATPTTRPESPSKTTGRRQAVKSMIF